MRRMVFVLVAVVALAGVVAYMAPVSGQADGEAAPIFVTDIPPGYRDWRLISVAHEEGDLNDLRAILGNDVAIKAYREGTLPFPDGTIIARLAWDYLPSEENNKVFGRAQSFMAGPPKNGVQFGVSANPLDGCGHILVQNFRRDSVDGRGALVEDAVAVDREASATPAA
jgi:hypothetical protein